MKLEIKEENGHYVLENENGTHFCAPVTEGDIPLTKRQLELAHNAMIFAYLKGKADAKETIRKALGIPLTWIQT